MASTKNEKARIAVLEHELRLARALRWTPPVAPDLPAPTHRGAPTRGWTFTAGAQRVTRSWSTSANYGEGDLDASGVPNRAMSYSRGTKALYSTESLALEAMRSAIAQTAAATLAAIDLRIQEQKAIECDQAATNEEGAPS